MSLPTQVFSNALDAPKGWPHRNALDYTAKVSANVLYDLVAGQCCHLNASGELEPGVANKQMPLFLLQGVNDFDVNPQGNTQWRPIMPVGNIACLVGKGSFELTTTAFDVTQTYAPNDLLKAPVGNAANQVGISGWLTNATITLYTTAVVGVVSKGVYINAYGVQVLQFWPVYTPGTA